MRRYLRPVPVIMIILFICFMASSNGFAQTYKWEDFTKPLQGVIKVAPAMQIELDLPEYILKEFKEFKVFLLLGEADCKSKTLNLVGMAVL